jgi:hypothetical protein
VSTLRNEEASRSGRAFFGFWYLAFSHLGVCFSFFKRLKSR